MEFFTEGNYSERGAEHDYTGRNKEHQKRVYM